METPTEEAVKSLLKLSVINAARMEGYESAISKACKGDMKKYLKEKVKEIVDLTNQINHLIQGSLENSEHENAHKEGEKIHQSTFFFTMAKASDNPRTVMLSCQLGDECAVTAYQDTLKLKGVKSLPNFREILVKHLSNLEESLLAIRQLLFDTSFA